MTYEADRERAEREARFAADMLHRNLGTSDLRRAVDALHLAHQYATRVLEDAMRGEDWEECRQCSGHGVIEVHMNAHDPAALREETCEACNGRGETLIQEPTDQDRLDIEESMDYARERERRALGDAGR